MKLAMFAMLAGVVVASPARADAVHDDEAAVRVPGEVIRVEGRVPPTTPPKATNYIKSKAPPYSDRAILSDAWTRAWLVLDIDERGTVTRVKLLQRPGYDLDDIAVSEAFKLRFAPALDAHGKPMRTSIVWDIEWPSAWWLSEFEGTRSTMPEVVGFPPRRRDWYVPCRGSGPWAMGSVRPMYKDCSKPDLSRADREPWIYPKR